MERPPWNSDQPLPVAWARARQTRGLLLTLGATTAWSSAGLFVRLVETGRAGTSSSTARWA